MGYISSRKKNRSIVFTKAKKRRLINIISRVNSNLSNYFDSVERRITYPYYTLEDGSSSKFTF